MNFVIAMTEESNMTQLQVTTPDGRTLRFVPATDCAAEEMETTVASNATTTAALETAAAAPKVTTIAAAETATETATATETVKALAEKIAAMSREYERLKKAAYRAGKRLEQNLTALGQVATPHSADSIPASAAGLPPCPGTVPANVPAAFCSVPGGVPDLVPGDTGTGQAVAATQAEAVRVPERAESIFTTTTNPVTTSNSNHVNNNNVINENNNDNNMIMPYTTSGGNTLIPLAHLPEAQRKIVRAWNQLDVPQKLKGLFPNLAQKLRDLLEEYGEATLHRAIGLIAESPFLLGKAANSTGWVIRFGWLLQPQNLQKVLENKYRNRERNAEYDDAPACLPWGKEYATDDGPAYNPWEDEYEPADGDPETDTDPVPQVTFVDPTEVYKGFFTLSESAHRNMMAVADKLGLTKLRRLNHPC